MSKSQQACVKKVSSAKVIRFRETWASVAWGVPCFQSGFTLPPPDRQIRNGSEPNTKSPKLCSTAGSGMLCCCSRRIRKRSLMQTPRQMRADVSTVLLLTLLKGLVSSLDPDAHKRTLASNPSEIHVRSARPQGPCKPDRSWLRLPACRGLGCAHRCAGREVSDRVLPSMCKLWRILNEGLRFRGQVSSFALRGRRNLIGILAW